MSTRYRLLLVGLLLLMLGQSACAESLLDALSEGVKSAKNAVSGLVDKVLPDDGQEGVPRRIGVLPATGDGSDESREDIRIAIHNSLGAKNFDLQKPSELDRNLKYLKQSLDGTPQALPPAELVKKLDLDGVLYVEVPSISRFYAGAYAHQEVEVHLKLFDATGKLIWEKTDSTIERDGGFSLDPLSILATVIGSTKVLTSGTQQALVDRLARRFATEIPNPKSARRKVTPPKVDVALSNAADGPFHAGEEIKVYLKAEPGLVVSFDLGQLARAVRMDEKSSGEYIGRYVVSANDNGENLPVVLKVQQVSDRQGSEWRVPGSIDIDTIPPGVLDGFRMSAVAEGIQINWREPVGNREKLTYQIERTDPATGVFTPLATVGITEYLDTTAKPGLTYHYRVHAVDAARNRGSFSLDKALALKAGPTPIKGKLAGTVTWYALGSPYVLEGAVTLARNAVLTIEPGTTIKFQPKASLEVQGQMLARGRADAQILFQSDQAQWTFNAGTAPSELNFVRLSGQNGQIQITESTVHFSDCDLSLFDTALLIKGDADVSLTRCNIHNNGVGIGLDNADLKLSDVSFRENSTAMNIEKTGTWVADKVRFDGNALHIVSKATVSLGEVVFQEKTYPELTSRLKGDIRINWDAMPPERNLKSQWLATLWQRYFLADKEGSNTLVQRTLIELQPFGNQVVQDLLQVYQLGSGQKVQPKGSLGTSYLNVQKTGHKPQLWLQEVKLPWRVNLTTSESYLMSQSQSKFASTYLAGAFPGADKTLLLTAGPKVDVIGQIQNGRLLYAVREGLYYKYWVAYIVNRTAIEHELLLAGIIKRSKMNLNIAIVNLGDQYQAQQRIIAKLDEQGLPFVNLGQGEYGPALRIRAQSQGAQVALETHYNMKVTSSQLSGNLKQYEATLQISLYDVARGVVINRFTANGRATDFGAKEGQEKALQDALEQIDRDLVTALWNAEEIVAKSSAESVAKTFGNP